MGEPRTSMDLMRETLLALTLDGTPYRIDGNGFVWLPRDDGVEGERTGREFKVLAHLAGRVRALEAALGEAKRLLRAGVDAQAFDGLDPLEAEVMVCLGHWKPDDEGGYVACDALAGEAVRG